MKGGFFFCALVFSFGLSRGEEVILKAGQDVVIQNPGYPSYVTPYLVKEWVVKAPVGNRIKLTCDDIRLYRVADDCPEYALRVDGGWKKSLCGSFNDVSETSLSNQMTLKLEIGEYGAGVVRCSVKAIPGDATAPAPSSKIDESPDSKSIRLTYKGNAYWIKNPEYPNYSQLKGLEWNFVTDPGFKIAVICDDTRFPGSEECYKWDYGVKSEDSVSSKITCLSGEGFVSQDPKLKVTILNSRGSSAVSCRVMAVKDDKVMDHFMRAESEEEDSSEHGVVQGRKKTTCKCGWSNRGGERVIGGKEALPNEYSFMVAFLYKGSQNCGGSILSTNYVLTAAHCTDRKKVEDLSVAVGAHSLKKGEGSQWMKVHDVVEKFEHPKYSPALFYANDIAILRVAPSIEFNAKVGPVCLPTGLPNMNYKMMTLMGWGYMNIKQNIAPHELQKAKVKHIDPVSCRVRSDQYLDVDHPMNVCYWGSNTTSPCQGDSGGPLLWVDPETNRYTQITLNSHFKERCLNDQFWVGPNVINYMDWIEGIIGGPGCKKVD